MTRRRRIRERRRRNIIDRWHRWASSRFRRKMFNEAQSMASQIVPGIAPRRSWFLHCMMHDGDPNQSPPHAHWWRKGRQRKDARRAQDERLMFGDPSTPEPSGVLRIGTEVLGKVAGGRELTMQMVVDLYHDIQPAETPISVSMRRETGRALAQQIPMVQTADRATATIMGLPIVEDPEMEIGEVRINRMVADRKWSRVSKPDEDYES
jgi:hypothetical protein